MDFVPQKMEFHIKNRAGRAGARKGPGHRPGAAGAEQDRGGGGGCKCASKQSNPDYNLLSRDSSERLLVWYPVLALPRTDGGGQLRRCFARVRLPADFRLIFE